jgi:excisionase family DNA binding protein
VWSGVSQERSHGQWQCKPRPNEEANVVTTSDALVTQAVKAALRESMEELRPAVTAAAREALAESGAPSLGTPAYLPVKEAAEVMSAHPTTGRKLIADGKLGRCSVAGHLRVKLSDIHAYVAREGRGSPTISLEERALEIIGETRRSGRYCRQQGARSRG